MSGQPVGAGGDALGAVAIVALNIVIQEKRCHSKYLVMC